MKDDTILAAEEHVGVPRSRVSTSMSSVGSYGKPQPGIPLAHFIYFCLIY